MDTEAVPESSLPGRVVLDIGGEFGAVIVYAPAAGLGLEVEIRAAGSDWDGRHVAVHRRTLPAGPVYAAVFPQLAEGQWEIRYRGVEPSPVVGMTVAGGCVTEASLIGG